MLAEGTDTLHYANLRTHIQKPMWFVESFGLELMTAFSQKDSEATSRILLFFECSASKIRPQNSHWLICP